MIAVRNWTLFRECLDEGPAGDVVPGEYARCYPTGTTCPTRRPSSRPCAALQAGAGAYCAPRILFEGRSGARASPTTPSRTAAAASRATGRLMSLHIYVVEEVLVVAQKSTCGSLALASL